MVKIKAHDLRQKSKNDLVSFVFKFQILKHVSSGSKQKKNNCFFVFFFLIFFNFCFFWFILEPTIERVENWIVFFESRPSCRWRSNEIETNVSFFDTTNRRREKKIDKFLRFFFFFFKISLFHSNCLLIQYSILICFNCLAKPRAKTLLVFWQSSTKAANLPFAKK